MNMNKKIFIGNRKLSGGETDHDIARIEEAIVQPRRAVLRGALAVGCGLLVPAALLGCEAGKEPETGAENDSAAPTADPASAGLPEPAPAPGAESAAPAAPEKVSQASVQYQTQPKGDQKCANCTHFIAESNTCQRVEGDISPDGWCTLWAKGGLSGRYQRGGKPMTMLA